MSFKKNVSYRAVAPVLEAGRLTRGGGGGSGGSSRENFEKSRSAKAILAHLAAMQGPFSVSMCRSQAKAGPFSGLLLWRSNGTHTRHDMMQHRILHHNRSCQSCSGRSASLTAVQIYAYMTYMYTPPTSCTSCVL